MLGFLRRILSPPEAKALDVNSAWALVDFGRSTAAGLYVSPETALRCSAVRGAVAVIAESIAQLPLLLYRRNADGGKERAEDHALYPLLHDQVNDFTSSYEWRRDCQVDLLLYGSCFSHIGRSRATGQVVELLRLPPSAVTVEFDSATYEPQYFVTDGQGVRRQIDRADILHITATGRRAPIDDLREAIALSLVMEQHQSKLFANGARPAGMLKIKGRLNPATLQRLQQDFGDKWNGVASSGKTMILEDDASFEPVTFKSTDVQMLELRKFQVSEVARALRVPPHMLADLERTTHHNAEEMGQQFLQGCLLAWLTNWEGALRRSLLSPEERQRFTIEFLTDGIARAALAQRYEAFAKATAGAAWMSANEARARENLPPVDGGDALMQPLNMQPSDQAEPVA